MVEPNSLSPPLNAHHVPLSAAGSVMTFQWLRWPESGMSWMIRHLRGGDLNSEHGRLLRCQLLDANGHCPPLQAHLQPGCLQLSGHTVNLHATTFGRDGLLLQLNAAQLQLSWLPDSDCSATLLPSGQAIITFFAQNTRLLLAANGGEWTQTPTGLHLQQTGLSMELQVQLYRTIPPLRQPQNRSQLQQQQREQWQQFHQQFGPVPPQLESAKQQATYLLWLNQMPVEGCLRRPAIYMSKNEMNNIWAWDCCFTALALPASLSALAWDQILLFADHQDDSGALPDFINDSYCYYAATKPPVHGWACSKMMRRSPLADDDKVQLYRFLSRWTGYWQHNAERLGSALPCYGHGYDSGWDNSSIFAHTPLVSSPDLLTFLILQTTFLAQLAQQLGLQHERQHWQDLGHHWLTALQGLWDGRRFFAVHALSGQPLTDGDSLINFIPLLLGDRLTEEQRQALKERILGPDFFSPHGLATESLSSTHYRENGYWLGPVWAPTNLLFLDAFIRQGWREHALELASRYCQTLAQHGMFENHCPRSGRGWHDSAFSWTAAVFLLFAQLLGRQQQPQQNLDW